MSDNEEIFEKPITESTGKQSGNKSKPKRKPLTPERKAQLLENLKKGRETSALNRQKKAQVKKILKKEANEEIDNVIKKDLMKKSKKNDEIDLLKKEIEQLKKSKVKKSKVNKNDDEEELMFDIEIDGSTNLTASLDAPLDAPLDEPKPKLIVIDEEDDKALLNLATHIQQAPLIKKKYSTYKKSMWQ